MDRQIDLDRDLTPKNFNKKNEGAGGVVNFISYLPKFSQSQADTVILAVPSQMDQEG
jgi:hypothetical protein